MPLTQADIDEITRFATKQMRALADQAVARFEKLEARMSALEASLAFEKRLNALENTQRKGAKK